MGTDSIADGSIKWNWSYLVEELWQLMALDGGCQMRWPSPVTGYIVQDEVKNK